MNTILVIGGTGDIGKHVVRASIKQGHPTLVYARPITPQTSPAKLLLHQEFIAKGVTIFQGQLDEHDQKLMEAVSKADIVISTLAFPQILDQLKIIQVMKATGNVKRFIPSEFGMDEARITALKPFQSYLDRKGSVRRATEASGIPYTYFIGNCCAQYFLHVLFHPYNKQEDTVIYGTGETKVVMNLEEDIGMYTVLSANDPRTKNRTVILRPPKNFTSQLKLISIWERLTGEHLKKVYLSAEEIHNLTQTMPHPENARFAVLNSVFVRGGTADYELNENEHEATELYPDATYSFIDEIVEDFLADTPAFQVAAF